MDDLNERLIQEAVEMIGHFKVSDAEREQARTELALTVKVAGFGEPESSYEVSYVRWTQEAPPV